MGKPANAGLTGSWDPTDGEVFYGVWNHFTSTDRSNGLEDAAYDFGSIVPQAKALAVISGWNSYRDWRNHYISIKRLIWNEGLTFVGLGFPPAAAICGFSDVMDYADNHGWLKAIDDFMSTN